MKKYIIHLFLITAFTGCKEEYIGQYPVDDIPPAPVTNIKVENFSGGAKLTYTLPEEDDLLCVTAKYYLSNGRYYEMSSSAYVNTIELKGFGRGKKTNIEVVTVDKSYNESTPVIVEIEPLDSPIYEILNTLEVEDSFGGVRLYWENPLKESIVFGAMVFDDESKEFKHVETIYSSETAANRSVRGLESKPTRFAFYFRDTYDNYTDTLYTENTPIFEQELDKSLFMAMTISNKFPLHSYGGGKMEAMWDNVYNVADNLFYVNVSEEEIYFNFDMGVTARLSRFRLWTRRDFIFRLHHLRTFEIWGTDDIEATKNPDNWDGWFKIMDCESFRPSGLEEGGEPNAEETDYCLAGEEWEIPVEAPPFRYFRFLVHTTWGNSRAAFINEITIWGSPQ